MSDVPKRTRRWTVARHAVQAAALALFAVPLLVAGWGLLGLGSGGEEAMATPAGLPFFGSLSSSTVFGIEVLDPFAMLQVAAASKTFALDWLIAALPVLVVYGLVRGRAFCGWVCPVNLLLEIMDAVRRKLGIEVREAPVPRHAKLGIALAVLVLSALFSVPVFEAFSPVSALNKGLLFGAVTGLWVLLAIVLAELFWGHRVWCRALCPLGGFYQALGRVGQVNVRFDREACIHCDACKQACLADPAILDPVLTERDVIVRAGDCMACGSCVDACPTKALAFGLGRNPKPAPAEEPAAETA
ncbi:4Fe-4S binding protein [Arabiibacter massiliensis]|uniref:4Fe-4S binding protein n=1 Tax=Arabiibacter massiliensis TaxID=1870985 RepID=UPI0009BBDCEC|nr:4Fe-4S binding protein [Arabiibacter massiliensis]